jgi:hypothetical protein
MSENKKVRINLQDLKVKSFVTTPVVGRDAGTVRGLCELTETDCTATDCDYCTNYTDTTQCTGCSGTCIDTLCGICTNCTNNTNPAGGGTDCGHTCGDFGFTNFDTCHTNSEPDPCGGGATQHCDNGCTNGTVS